MTKTMTKAERDITLKEGHGDLDSLVGYNLKRAYVVINADYRAALGEDGLAPREFSALALIVQAPGITQSTLARHLGVERSGLVKIVDELEARAFVERQAVKGDRRVQALIATESGSGFYAKTLETVKAHEAKMLSSLSSDEVDTLKDLLYKIGSIEL